MAPFAVKINKFYKSDPNYIPQKLTDLKNFKIFDNFGYLIFISMASKVCEAGDNSF